MAAFPHRAVTLSAWVLSLGVLLSGCGFFVDTETRLARAAEYREQRDFRSAEIELRNVLQSEPGNAQARYWLAEAALELGDAATADKELRFAYDAGISRNDAVELDARIKLARNEYAALLADLESQSVHADEHLRNLLRGKALLGLRRLEEAEAAFKEVIAAGEHSPEAALGLVEVVAARGDVNAALAGVDDVLKVAPEQAEGWLMRGQMLLRLRRYDDARESFVAAHARAKQLTLSRYAILLGLLTESSLAAGDISGAADWQQQMSTLAPESPPTLYLKARLDIARQDYQTAIGELQGLLVKAPSFLAARELLGVAFLAQGALQQAENHLAQVVQLAPANREARKQLARVKLRLRNAQDAIDTLQPALGSGDAADPGSLDAEGRALLAEAYQLAGQTGRAREQYESLLAEGQGSASVLNNLAWLYHETGDHRAVDLARKALAMAPEAPSVADTLGWILIEQGEVTEGLPLIEQAVRAAPDDPEMQYHLAVALARSGRSAEARQRVGALLQGSGQFASRSAAERLAAELGN